MTTETRAALNAALATEEFAGVRAALEHEAERCRNEASEGRFTAMQCWREAGWQAAWREISKKRNGNAGMVCVGAAQWEECFLVRGKVVLTGDKLAAALRDFALGETR